ncbi:MAG: prepilin-type N-terminal cleavage/methylation domain-containing protein [Candidatus Omnitrophica bacterium]|nr:prepilin-type N-terminal cleavage/methylation domain-containing protein [Candidatus Omnitrophota bacterium]
MNKENKFQLNKKYYPQSPKGDLSLTGFTLLEVLMVVIIIGVLATLAIPQYTKTVEKARASEAYSNLGTLRKAEWIFYNDRSPQTFTAVVASLDIENPNSMATRNFNYTITASSSTFTVTATRASGTNAGETITINQAGAIGGNWTP